MKSKTILGADGATKMRQITVGIHGKGGETGIKAIMLLTALINDLKQCEIRHNRGNGQRNTYSKYAGNCGYRCKPD